MCYMNGWYHLVYLWTELIEVLHDVVAGLEGEGGAEAEAGVAAGGAEAPQNIQTRLNPRNPRLWYVAPHEAQSCST